MSDPNLHESPQNSDPLVPSPCHTCNQHPTNDDSRKNLIVCIQSMLHLEWPGATSSNVQRIFDCVETEHSKYFPEQLRYMPAVRNVHRMRNIVEDTYGWLARHYNLGDQIYLFGFGRGAYAARALTGMIYDIGLTQEVKTTKELISRAYDLYELNRSQPSSQTRKNASQFKLNNCWKDLRVHFVGVWDTLCPIERMANRVLPVSSPEHACHFRHALALDEDRDRLYPEYLQGTIYSNIEESHDINTRDVKEVWFTGDHCDLGGGPDPDLRFQYRPISSCGRNAPLLWMHREASENGLILKPLDLDYFPGDCYFLPQRVQRSRSRFSQPRHFLSGQKIHVTVSLDIKYRHRNTLIDDIPDIQCSEINEENEIWEPALFNDSLAQQFIDHSQDDPIPHPIKLLYMLQFKQGKECVRRVPGCRETLKNVIERQLKESETWRAKEFAVCLAYWVAFCEGDADSSCSTDVEEREWILRVLGQALKKHVGWSKQFPFPPLIRDKVLRQKFLTPKRVRTLIKRLDGDTRFISPYPKVEDPDRWIEVIADLASCEHLQTVVIEELEFEQPESSRSRPQSRLAWMLKMSDTRDLTAALHIVQSLSRSPRGTKLCATVKSRLEVLTTKSGHIGMLAAEALILLRISKEAEVCKNLHSRDIRAGFLFACNHWNMGSSQAVYSEDYATSHQVLDHFFTTEALSSTQEELLHALLISIKGRNRRERTTAIFTLLKLCQNAKIRTWLLNKRILDIFVRQLADRNGSLLAAHAILVCLEHDDLKSSIYKDSRVPKYVVKMLRLGCFNNWLGQIEGFQILGGLMANDVLGPQFKEHGMLEVLESKLYAFRQADMWRRLAYPQSNLLRCFEKNIQWTNDLVNRGVEKLKQREWSDQKVGVAVLAALAQTENSVNAIEVHIRDIVKLLLDAHKGKLKMYAILGPACALRILSENETFRKQVRDIAQYKEWKRGYLHDKDNLPKLPGLFRILYPILLPKEYRNKTPWHVKTPNLGDVQAMLGEAIRAIDEKLSGDESPPVEETLPPHIAHWQPLFIVAGIGVYIVLATPIISGLGAVTLPIATVFVFTYQGGIFLVNMRRSRAARCGNSGHAHRADQDDGEVSTHADSEADIHPGDDDARP